MSKHRELAEAKARLEERLKSLRATAATNATKLSQLEAELAYEGEQTQQIESAIVNARVEAKTIESQAQAQAETQYAQQVQAMQAQLHAMENRFKGLQQLGLQLIEQKSRLQNEIEQVLHTMHLRIDALMTRGDAGVAVGETEAEMEVAEEDVAPETESAPRTVIQFPDKHQGKGSQDSIPTYIFSKQ